MVLDLSDIQSGVLSPRPAPYAATYLLLHIDQPANGRALMRRLADVVPSAADTASPIGDAWISVALTFSGLECLGLEPASLDTFPPEFKQGMAARAALLGDTGESGPEHWEPPLGSRDVHVVLTALAPDSERLDAMLQRGSSTYRDLSGVRLVWRQDCYALADGKEAFGFRDGISQPAVEGSGVPASNPLEPPIKAGEFVLGYPNESGLLPPMPDPEVLGRNGTFVVFRKLHQRAALFRQYLRAHAACAEEEELLAAKMMGRWRSGAPLALSPSRDDAALGADPRRRNAFSFEDDEIGYTTPKGCHIRRANPRATDVSGVVRLHRMIRRGTSYGPSLPNGQLEDDGVDRGLMFAFVGASLTGQFEFVQREWLNNGEFISQDNVRDPIMGSNDDDGTFDIPRRPIRERLVGLPRFVVTRGGEYCFMPGKRALRWLGGTA